MLRDVVHRIETAFAPVSLGPDPEVGKFAVFPADGICFQVGYEAVRPLLLVEGEIVGILPCQWACLDDTVNQVNGFIRASRGS